MHKHGGLTASLTTQFLVGIAVSALTGCARHRLVSALFASQRPPAVCVLPHCFWHNSACSGFHPPASVMKLLSPTQHQRLNEIVGFLLLSVGLVMLLSLVSYHAQDPSWDTASDVAPSQPRSVTPAPSSPTSSSRCSAPPPSVPAAHLSALLEMDSLRRTPGRRRQDLRLDPADPQRLQRCSPSSRSGSSAAPSHRRRARTGARPDTSSIR